MLTHWHSVASNLFKISRICNSQFKCNYLKNQNIFLNSLFHFLNLHQLLNILNKTWLSELTYFRNYRLWKSWLDYSLKSSVSEQALTVNIWERPKCFLNFNESAFITFFLSFSVKLILKMSSLVLGGILGCLLTHWLLMASIVFKVVRTCNSQFKCNYLKNDKLFLKFLFHFLNLHQILNISKEKMIVIANVFPKLQTVKSFVRKLSQEHRFRKDFGSQLVKALQMLAKIRWETFIMFFIIMREFDLENVSPSFRWNLRGVC